MLCARVLPTAVLATSIASVRRSGDRRTRAVAPVGRMHVGADHDHHHHDGPPDHCADDHYDGTADDHHDGTADDHDRSAHHDHLAAEPVPDVRTAVLSSTTSARS
jgi:hypothetical protein